MNDDMNGKEKREKATAFRDAVLEGYADIVEGRTMKYQGDVMQMIKDAEQNGLDV